MLGPNLTGSFLVAQVAARLMRQSSGGTIINVASILGERVAKGLAAYAASKAGLIKLTKALALEWAPLGIRVNALAPGYVETDFSRDFFASDAGKRLIARIPQQRLGQMSDLDGPMLLLCTDDFYFDVLRQVKMDRWSNGRIVLTGDASWCATPLSAIGTSLAIVGGYVLAGELARTDDHRAALSGYESVMRPHVKEGQGVPEIVPRMLWPYSAAELSLLRIAVRLAGKPAMRKTFAPLFARDAEEISLPNYDLPAAEDSYTQVPPPASLQKWAGIAVVILEGLYLQDI